MPSVQRTFPIGVKIGETEFFQFESLQITRSIRDFVDVFTMNVHNPESRYSTSVPIGAVVEFRYGGVLFFRGLIENKTVNLKNIGSNMVLSGREELVVLTEDDASPTLGPFKNLTDNEIMKQVIGTDLPWDLELGTAVKIKEYTVSDGVRKGQIIEDLAKMNDFLVYKKGAKLLKVPVPRTPNPTGKTFTMTVSGGQFHIHNQRILEVTLTEDITACRSRLTGMTYTQGKSKAIARAERVNTDLTSGKYAQRLRNKKSELVGAAITRNRYITTPAKDADELSKNMDRALFESDVQSDVTLKVYGVSPVELLDTVDVQIEQEGILQYMYVRQLVYNLESTNALTTTITCSPFPKV